MAERLDDDAIHVPLVDRWQLPEGPERLDGNHPARFGAAEVHDAANDASAVGADGINCQTDSSHLVHKRHIPNLRVTQKGERLAKTGLAELAKAA